MSSQPNDEGYLMEQEKHQTVCVPREQYEALIEMAEEGMQYKGEYLSKKYRDQERIDAARALLAQPVAGDPVVDICSIVTEALIGMVSSVSGMTPPPNEPPPQFIQEAIDRAVDRISGVISHPPAPAIPEGYALVPIKPTQAMFEAGRTSASGNASEKLAMASYWRSMLAASPQPTEGSTND